MSRLTVTAAAAAMALAAQPGAAQAVLGPDAAACRSGSRNAALLVDISGFRERTGTLRVQLYGGNPADWLARGRYLKRIDLPVAPAGRSMPVCVALPGPGRYAVAVRHDEDGDGRTGWSDGGGFSRNPVLSLAGRPLHEEVAIEAGGRVERIEVLLNYRTGLTIAPVEGG